MNTTRTPLKIRVITILGVLLILFLGISLYRHVTDVYLNGFDQGRAIRLAGLVRDFYSIYGQSPAEILAKPDATGFLRDWNGNPIDITFTEKGFALRYEPSTRPNLLFTPKPDQLLTITWQVGDRDLSISSTIARP